MSEPVLSACDSQAPGTPGSVPVTITDRFGTVTVEQPMRSPPTAADEHDSAELVDQCRSESS
ncbi:hypothetical protein [Saccharopolyspora sp. 5N708]|uniref:hypothetical protein n=1 Tax=Saccharopolyspora sp. 5N708 TaxID=3457424 RepID=UPI003FD032EC